MSKSRARLVVSAVVLGGSLAAIGLDLKGLPPPGPGAVEREVGHALAREAQRLLGPSGHVVVVARDPAAYRAPADAAVLDALESGLGRAGAAVSQRQFYAVDPLRPPQVPPGDFFEVLRRAGAGDVVVSLLGPPLLTDDQRVALGVPQAKVVAFCPGAMADYVNLPLLAESGLLHGGVFARPAAASAGAAPVPETFDGLYTAGLPKGAGKP